jgi:hypothetical protein
VESRTYHVDAIFRKNAMSWTSMKIHSINRCHLNAFLRSTNCKGFGFGRRAMVRCEQKKKKCCWKLEKPRSVRSSGGVRAREVRAHLRERERERERGKALVV